MVDMERKYNVKNNYFVIVASPGSGMMNSVLRQLSLRRVENGDH